MQPLRIFCSIALIGVLLLLIAWNLDLADLLKGFQRLAPAILMLALLALVANSLAAALRLSVISGDVGHRISFQHAMAAVSGGSLAGAAFFQAAGQLMARGYIMGRSGIPFASVAVMIMYERFVSAIVSALLALGGAYFIFGRIYLDQNAGGGELIKIIAGLIAATVAGALIGHGRTTARLIAPLLSQDFAKRFLHVVGLSLLVQLPMMAAYITLTQALSPQTPLPDIAAATAVVMFAASIPISLAGWGVREMSAVFALGAIGVGVSDAFLVAVLVGAGSMLSMAIIGAVARKGWSGEIHSEPKLNAKRLDLAETLGWLVPLAAATLVLFQIYVPIASGTQLNVNLADPLAILAGIMLTVHILRTGDSPEWRFKPLMWCLLAATAVLTLSLAIGAWQFGWTPWALVNRFLGWFILLSFAATGATIVKTGGEQGLKVLLLSYAGATAAIAVMELVLMLVRIIGLDLPLPLAADAIEGFSENRNFFAFQLLMAIAAVITAVRGKWLRIGMTALMLTGLWFTGSRSGWMTFIVLATVAFWLKATNIREFGAAVGVAVVAVLSLLGLSVVISSFGVDGLSTSLLLRPLVPSAGSTSERWLSIETGLELFYENPLLGAGLGAFRHLGLKAESQLALLIHSTPVWLLAEAGIVGFIAFFGPAVILFVQEARRPHKDDAAKLILLCLAVLGAMSVPADMLYQRTFWLLLGAALALPFVRKRQAA